MIIMIFFGTFILLTSILISGFVYYFIKHITRGLKKKEPKFSNKKFNDSLINLFHGLDNELVPNNIRICEYCGYDVIMNTKKCPNCETKL